MKTARRILLAIGYTIFFSFFIYSLYFSITTLNLGVTDSVDRVMLILTIIYLGCAFYGLNLILAFVSIILNFKLTKREEKTSFILDSLLIIFSILGELILVFMLLGV